MKNNKLKIGFIIMMSFAICSLKAQSLQQKFQKDMVARKKNVDAVVLKAREQQTQQQAERNPVSNATNTQLNIQAGSQPASNVPIVKTPQAANIKPSERSMRTQQKPTQRKE
jgi:hypothetical protein